MWRAWVCTKHAFSHLENGACSPRRRCSTTVLHYCAFETTADVCDGTQPYCDIDYFAIHCAALICTCVFTGNATQVSLQVSGDGKRVLLVAMTGSVLLWECMDVRDLMGLRDGTVKGRWAHIRPLSDSILPSAREKEASQHTIFVKTEVSILKRRHSWHVGSPFSQLKTCTPFVIFCRPYILSCPFLRLWVMPACQPLFSQLGRS